MLPRRCFFCWKLFLIRAMHTLQVYFRITWPSSCLIATSKVITTFLFLIAALLFVMLFRLLLLRIWITSHISLAWMIVWVHWQAWCPMYIRLWRRSLYNRRSRGSRICWTWELMRRMQCNLLTLGNRTLEPRLVPVPVVTQGRLVVLCSIVKMILIIELVVFEITFTLPVAVLFGHNMRVHVVQQTVTFQTSWIQTIVLANNLVVSTPKSSSTFVFLMLLLLMCRMRLMHRHIRMIISCTSRMCLIHNWRTIFCIPVCSVRWPRRSHCTRCAIIGASCRYTKRRYCRWPIRRVIREDMRCHPWWCSRKWDCRCHSWRGSWGWNSWRSWRSSREWWMGRRYWCSRYQAIRSRKFRCWSWDLQGKLQCRYMVNSSIYVGVGRTLNASAGRSWYVWYTWCSQKRRLG